MADEKKTTSTCNCKPNNAGTAAGGGAVYGIGLIGALIYFISNANSFWEGCLGILKSLVWPAMMVYHLFQFLRIN